MTVRRRAPLAVSVVIPCHGRLASLERAVCSVLASASAVEGEVEVILVDDCSPTPVREALQAKLRDARVRFLRHDANRGPAAARNTGVAQARFELVLFTDDDVVVDARWIERLARYLADAPRRVGGVGGRVRALGTDLFSRYFEYHHILDPFRMDDGRVLYVVTACCGYRRSVLQEVGALTRTSRLRAAKIPALPSRSPRLGMSSHVVEDALVHHDFRLGLRDFWRTFRRYGRGCRHQVERHWRGFASPRRASGGSGARDAVATFGGQLVEVPDAESL
ncbi:MAG: glycosyltransferase family 2 protein [Myxococcales bacterium]|nr:glycosyltransferase family 2 protein [Myxococcales bacterium]